MSGSTAGRIAAQRRAGKAEAGTGKRAHGSTIGRLLATQEGGAAQAGADAGDEPTKSRRSRKASTAQRYAARIRAEHPDAGQHHDPGRPRPDGSTTGEKLQARLRPVSEVDPMAPPPAA